MQRRKRLKTKQLQSAIAPYSLHDILHELKQRGDVEWYEIGKITTIIKLTVTTDLATLLKEQTTPIANPRPYIANKSNDPWKKRQKG